MAIAGYVVGLIGVFFLFLYVFVCEKCIGKIAILNDIKKKEQIAKKRKNAITM